MPKQTLPLTDSQCKKLQPPNQLSDGGGLYLQARGNGKYWRFRYYRPSDNKRDEMRLGVYPEISLKEAREKREELRGLIAKGIDPKLRQQDKAQRQAEQLKNTFEAIARKWHSDQVAKPNKWKPDHAQRVIRSLELHIFPDLATRKIDEIMPLEVLGLLQRLESAGKYDTAQKVYDVVNQVFKYAVKLRLSLFNPAAELRGELAKVEPKHYRFITDPQKLGEVLRAFDGYTGFPQTRALLQLSPYVFARPSELRLLRWCEIDWEEQQYYKDGVNMKNKIDHIVPLSRQALAILDGLKPVTGHYDYVFCNTSKKQPLSEGAIRKALERLGFLEEGGSGFDLLTLVFGYSFTESVNQVSALLGLSDGLKEWATFICSHYNNGAGDGFGLVMHYLQCDFQTALKQVAGVLGMDNADPLPIPPKRPQAQPRPEKDQIEKLAALWRSTEPIRPDSPVIQ